MEGSDSVARFELVDIGADTLDYSGDIIALVDGAGAQVRKFPVFGVAAGDDDADEDLVVVDFRDG